MYMNIFAAAVPNANREAYIDHCTMFGDIITAHGCLRYVECWAKDVPDGEVTSFIKAVKAGDDESVVVGWGEWPDKATCDAAMEKVMADDRMQALTMPFDGKRLIYGGFDVILNREG
ncbi:MAG: DUF1428 domain-containing protein [Pseudomonadota bacterium]